MSIYTSRADIRHLLANSKVGCIQNLKIDAKLQKNAFIGDFNIVVTHLSTNRTTFFIVNIVILQYQHYLEQHKFQ